ncbi:MAG: NERD domain-containing protein [Chloroflexi bacterium]|nr:NERD domain-containing protein [Chloroflexota bacterium]
MKIIDQSPYRNANGQITLKERLRASLRYGFGWYGEMQAQDIISRQLARHLPDSYTLLRNLPLEGLDQSSTMVLVGPSGVRAIHANASRGIYRVKENTWSRFDSRARRFRPAAPNVIRRTIDLAHALRSFLNRRGLSLLEVEPVVMFSTPGLHVDTVRSHARIVVFDGIEHYGSGLLSSRVVLDRGDVEAITNLLLHPDRSAQAPVAAATPAPASRAGEAASPFALAGGSAPDDFPRFDDDTLAKYAPGSASDRPAPSPTRAAGEDLAARPAEAAAAPPGRAPRRKPALSRRQVTLLIGLAVINLCTLASCVILLLFLR